MPCKKKLSQKHDPPPEKKNDTRDKDRIGIQSPPKRTHGIIVRNPINLKTIMPNVGYAFEHLHCYNDIQTFLTAWGAHYWILLTVTDLSDRHWVFTHCETALEMFPTFSSLFFNAGSFQNSKIKKIQKQRCQDFLPLTCVQTEKSRAINNVFQEQVGRWQNRVLTHGATFLWK